MICDGTSRDNLVAVIIESLPAKGTLQVGGSDATVDQRVLVADISTISFAPVAGDTGEIPDYSSFTFNVGDDGAEGTGDKTSITAATMTIVLTAQVPNATGAPVISCAAAPVEDGACNATNGNIADEDGLTAFSWQWRAGTPAAAPNAADLSLATFDDITGATSTTFTPGQEQVGHFLRVCARFTDMGGTREGPLCATSSVVVANINDPVGGAITLGYAPVSVATEDSAITAGSAAITDEDGLDNAVHNWQWSQDNGGDGNFAPIVGADEAAFTPLQAHVGNALRVCTSFNDDHGGLEMLCIDTAAVTNVSDAPVAIGATVESFNNATSDFPFIFGEQHFQFTDEDEPDDSLVNIVISAAPTAGTLRRADGAITRYPATVTMQQIADGELGYYPADGAESQDDYARFTYNVTDSGTDNGSALSTNNAVITINLVPPGPVTASGAPTVTAAGIAYAEDTRIVAGIDGIREPNGINEGTLAWQWQLAAADNGAPPAADSAAWSDITNAGTTATPSVSFTPRQAHVGRYLRVRVTFTDTAIDDEGRPSPTNEGPLYSVPGLVTNTNDAPTSADAAVDVFTSADAGHPHSFTGDDFPFADEDAGQPSGGTLASVTMMSTIASGTGTFTHSGNPVSAGTTVQIANIGGLQYHPPAGTEAAADYASFRFTVSDGTASSGSHTMTINLVPPAQAAASGAPTVTASGTAYAEDNELTASTDGVRDPNRIDSSTVQWQWQWAAANSDGTYPAADSAAWSDIPGGRAAAYTPRQAQVAQYIRACLSFDDLHTDGDGNPAPNREGPLCSAPGLVTNTPDAVSGMPAIALVDAAGAILNSRTTTVAEGQLVAAFANMGGGSVADDDGVPDDFAYSIQRSADGGATWSEVATGTRGATLMPYEVTQADADAGHLRACIFFADIHGMDNNGGNAATMAGRLAGTLCSSGHAVTHSNDAPTGAPTLSYAGGITAATEDSPITASESGITDEDGTTGASYAWQWHQAAAAAEGETLGDDAFAAIEGATGTTFTPANDNVGQVLRVCASYRDDQGKDEMVCADTAAVANTNDAPVPAADSRILVLASATADAGAHQFSADDFPFRDDDDDALMLLHITALPTAGTLANSGTAVAAGDLPLRVAAADMGNLSYYPAAGLSDAASGYATLMFTLTDDGDGPAGDPVANKVSAEATLSIDLAPTAQVAASGAPTVAATDASMIAHNEDVQLSASTAGITEPNGIDPASLAWQWQQAAPASGGAAPADGDYADIADATAATFTPLQAQVGQYIRVCVSFDDRHADADTAGAAGLCSATAIIANVNDAAAGAVTLGYADGITAATEGSPITANGDGITDEDGTTNISIVWQWAAAATTDGSFTDIAAATAAEYSPMAAEIGMFLRACARFADDTGNSEQVCAVTDSAVVNVNAAAAGAPTLSYASGIAAATEDSTITASESGITDEDGTAGATFAWQWHQAAAAAEGETLGDDDFATIEGAGIRHIHPPADSGGPGAARLCIIQR